MKPTILLAEDEEHLQDAIKLNLELEGYAVVLAKNGAEALVKFKENECNLLVLDVMMPELDGFSVCQKVRETNSEVPILFLTARNAAEDKIKGFTIGGMFAW